MAYSLRNIIIGYIAVFAVVLLILINIYSTLISQEKEQVQISKARTALQKLEPSIQNAQELELVTTNYVRRPDSLLREEYYQLINSLYNDSSNYEILATLIPENKQDYQQLSALTKAVIDSCNNIMNAGKSSNPSVGTIHSEVIGRFRQLASSLEEQNRQLLNASYSNSIGYTRKTFTFVRLILTALILLLIMSFFFVFKDIRNRKKTEATLKLSNVQLEKQVDEKTKQIIKEKDLSDSIINSLPGVFFLQDADGHYIRWNKEMEKISGYSSEEISKLNALDFFDNESKIQIGNAQKKIFENGSAQIEASAITKDGQLVPFLFTGMRINYEGKNCIIGTGIDISQRTTAEAENTRMRNLLNERVKELTTLYRCSQLLQTEKKSIHELLQNLVEIIPGGWQYPEITAAKIQLGDRIVATSNYNEGKHRQSASFSTPEGVPGELEVVYLENRPGAAEDAFSTEERDLINMIASMIADSLDHRHHEEELIKSEANLHSIFDITDTIYILLDNNFRVISYNKPAIRFTAEQLGKDIQHIQASFMQYFSTEPLPVLKEWLRNASTGDHVTYEQAYAQPDGATNWYSIRMFPITSSHEKKFGLMLAVTDITGNKISEQEILDREVQSQKKITRAVLKAQETERNKIGQELHDNVNQILASTKLYLSMALTEYKDEHQFIKHSIGFVEDAIAEIRMLSSREVSPLQEIDLKELLLPLVEQLNHRSGIYTKFHFDLAHESLIEDDLKLNIYRIIQEQVTNMMKHAEANNAQITIEDKQRTLHVEIKDDGIGFNTSEKRKGIGISNVINRVKSYNGVVNIESSPGKGCRTEIKIPF